MTNGLLIANRGEIAVRIARSAAELGIRTVAVHPDDDARALHTRVADAAHRLDGRGADAYLDAAGIVAAARVTGCGAIHPGYGFLSENAGFARRCEEHGIIFVGPTPETLDLLGDKTRARALAVELGIPVIPGTGPATLADAHAFLADLGPGAAVMVKAVAGGGGRGMRVVRAADALDEAFARCAAEARAAFGDGTLYLERFIPRARHLEVQILGDGRGGVVHLWERECSLQRRNQKLVEVAPGPSLSATTRQALLDHALRMARAVGYRGAGTFEFLLDADRGDLAFIEANPRIQVEHTVTEEVTGVDIVRAQLRIAGGATLEELGLTRDAIPAPVGHAVQVRVNMETMNADGTARPAGGVLEVYEPPGGPGVRVDGSGYRGYPANPRYDSLLAKVIVHARTGGFDAAIGRAYRALCQFRVTGVNTNIGFLQNLLALPEVRANDVHTRFVDERAADLAGAATHHPRLYVEEEAATAAAAGEVEGPPGTVAARAPMTGLLVELRAAEGEPVRRGAALAVIEAMKMQHLIAAPVSGIVRALARVDDTVAEGAPLAFIEPAEVDAGAVEAEETADPDAIRPDLAEAIARHAEGLDAGRPDAVTRRHAAGKRTARENIADLCDPDSFVEYGALAVAAQRSRHPVETLRAISPADGLVSGIGAVNGALFGPERARCAVMAYDYTVFAGTQGHMGHRKTDRLLDVAEKARLPVVVFAEGGGGRPGDTDNRPGVNLANPTFWRFARMSAVAPLVGIVSGRCFAGNAAVLGCCDVVIATRDATIGMGGPAMIEGAGLGTVAPEDVGPVAVQEPNGVIDLVAGDEAEATRLAKTYLSYFQGPVADWRCADQRRLRAAVPENRLRAYDVRTVIDTLADEGSVLELRRRFGPGLVTALVRLEGRPAGLIANVPAHRGGAVDRDEADKAARFMKLCDAFGLPIVSLCDTPGFMVGPEAEKRATVRHFARLFLVGASLSVPLFTVILRKAYGLGAMAMSGGSFHESSLMTLSWPTGEFGAMGLEGAVRLGYRKELEAIVDTAQRQARYEELVARLYTDGKAVNIAPFLSIDDVIDPADTRRRLVAAMTAAPRVHAPKDARRPLVDAW
ncbi:acetyl-CoA carboxylase family protein [Azospirillum halopraeferens]|uniref:acetyl-CoA carboxylase family protein n=1 Tax=Azospirillum halopraeferens TaxID=34010 RepID=UPI0003FAA7C0|nr:carboxyl transferase domain-containing protein [Azospirillum halopraeferens]